MTISWPTPDMLGWRAWCYDQHARSPNITSGIIIHLEIQHCNFLISDLSRDVYLSLASVFAHLSVVHSCYPDIYSICILFFFFFPILVQYPAACDFRLNLIYYLTWSIFYSVHYSTYVDESQLWFVQKEAEDVLTEALPALEAARLALDDLDRNDVTEIRPVAVLLCITALLYNF